MTIVHRTERLLLRQWREEDRTALAAINANADVMRYFPRRYTSAESDEFVRRNARSIAERGWGNWAVEIVESGEFAGFVGLSRPAEWHPCAGRTEIGWRLDACHWRRGYATEAARRALDIGFASLGLDEIFSWTSVLNRPSIAVMKRLGMRREAVGFDHPRIGEHDPLRPHVVYRLNRERARGEEAPREGTTG